MKRKFLILISTLLLATGLLFAGDAASSYNLFSSSLSEPEKAISYYEDALKSAEKESKKLKKSLDKAINARNSAKANEAYSKLVALNSYKITKEQSDELLASIIKNGSNAENLKWLYENSIYYNPVLTLSYSFNSGNRVVYKTKSVSLTPGETITLPNADEMASSNGVFAGWGVVEGTVAYQPGETIEAPVTSQTLYAVYKNALSFTDSVTGFSKVIEDVKEGDSVEVPALTSEDKSLYFEGWVNNSGSYIASDDESYTVEGSGSSFTALWDKAEIENIALNYYDLDNLKANTQASLGFTLKNSGTETLKNLSVKLEANDESVAIIKDKAYLPSLRVGSSVAFEGFTLVGTKPGTYTLTLTVEDGEEHIWAQDFSLTVK